MPTVPTYNDPQVAMRPLPDPALYLPGYATPGVAPMHVQSQPSTAGSVGQSLGQGAENLSGAAGQIADQMGQQVIATQANDAANQLMRAAQTLAYDPKQGYLAIKGADAAVPGPNGESLASTYGGKLQDQISQISQTIASPIAQRMFQMRANDMATQFQQGVQSHVLSEYKNWALTSQEGTASLATNQAAHAWNDPDQIGRAIDQAKAATYNAGQLKGLGAADIQANINSAVSGIHAKVIGMALENQNPTYAMTYFQQNKGQMDANDILRVQGLVNHATDSRIALTATQNAVGQYGGQINPSDSQRLLYLINGQESNHQDYAADGTTPLASKDGALFGMQVMPATAADPGHGIQPAQSQTPAEYNRVGQQLAVALVKKYGNVSQALAAYNAGEGNVDKAISDAQAADQPQNWMTYLAKYQSADNHQQTVNYVNTIMGKYSAGQGAPTFPTEAQFVNTALTSLGPNPRVEQVQLTRQQATAQYTMLQNSRKEQGQQAVMQAQQALMANGGNLAQLDPNLRMAVARYAPDKWDTLTDFAGHVADPVRSDNLVAYNQAYSNPQELAKMSDTDFQNFVQQNFTQRTGRQLVQFRQDVLTGKADTSAQSVNDAAVKQTLDARLQAIGLNPSPLRTDTTGMSQIGSIRQYVRDSIFADQQQSGQKMTPEQIQTKITRMFAQDTAFQHMFWPDGHMPTMSMQASDIPSDQLTQVKQLLASNGIRNPSDDQVIRAYWSSKNVR